MSDDKREFEGHSVDFWLSIRTSGDDESRWQSVDAIRHICMPDVSIPLFVDTLQSDPYWRARALAAHALYDLAFDATNRSKLSDVLPQIAAVRDDPSAVVQQQVRDFMDVLQESGPPT